MLNPDKDCDWLLDWLGGLSSMLNPDKDCDPWMACCDSWVDCAPLGRLLIPTRAAEYSVRLSCSSRCSFCTRSSNVVVSNPFKLSAFNCFSNAEILSVCVFISRLIWVNSFCLLSVSCCCFSSRPRKSFSNVECSFWALSNCSFNFFSNSTRCAWAWSCRIFNTFSKASRSDCALACKDEMSISCFPLNFVCKDCSKAFLEERSESFTFFSSVFKATSKIWRSDSNLSCNFLSNAARWASWKTFSFKTLSFSVFSCKALSSCKDLSWGFSTPLVGSKSPINFPSAEEKSGLDGSLGFFRGSGFFCGSRSDVSIGITFLEVLPNTCSRVSPHDTGFSGL